MSEIDCSWMKIFDAPVGGNELSPDAVYQGETVYLDISDMPAGYVFVGWTDLQGHTIEPIPVGDRYEVTITCGNGFKVYMRTQTEDECLVTVSWTPQQIQGLIASIVGGDSGLCNSTVDISAVSNNCCYEFEAWSDSDPDNQNPNRTVPVVTGANSYTAYFKKKSFQVTTDVNNPSYGTTSASVDHVECGDSITLTAVPNEGYVFDRWEPGGSTNSEFNIEEYNCEDFPDAYFKAIFSPKTKYKLTYDENYPGAPSPYSGGEYEVGDTVNLITVSRTGYNFLGWCHTPNPSTCNPINGPIVWPSLWNSDKTLYAKWEQVRSHTIHYYGSQNNPSDYQTSLWDDNQTENASFNLPTLNNTSTYRFSGWKILTNSEQSSDPYTPTNPTYSAFSIYSTTYTMPNEDLYAYAIWEEIENETFTLTYVANNGTQQTSTESGIQQGTSVNVKDPSNPNLSFTYPHHTFREWLDRATSTTYPANGQIPSFPSNNMTLEAQWDEDPQFTIDYNINGGQGQTPSSQSGYSNSNITLASDIVAGSTIFDRQGYTFLGWSTNPNASQPSYVGGQTIVLTQNMTLYAVWQENPKFRVRYDCGDSTVVLDPIEYDGGDTVTVGLCAQCTIPDGCSCKGWCTTPDCSGSDAISYQPGDTFIITENTTLYLQLEDCCYITFDIFCDGCDNNSPLPTMYYKKTPQGQSTPIVPGSTIPIDDDWIIDVSINYSTNPYCYFTGWFDADDLTYVLPDTGGCQWEWEYKLVPPQYVSTILSGASPSIYRLTDSAYNDEVKYKQNASTYMQGAYIYNTTTQEMRQLVKRCKNNDEAYDFSKQCGHTLIAVIECCSATITFDYQNVVEMDIDGALINSDITFGIRKGQNFNSGDFVYLQQGYYVSDIVDVDTGESVGFCDCCYIPFPLSEYNPKDGNTYNYYYEYIDERYIPNGITPTLIYDRKYIVGQNSPEYVELHLGQTVRFGRLRRIPCGDFSQIWNDITNIVSWFYDGVIDNFCNCSTPLSVPTCDANSPNMIFCKALEVAMIKHKTNCTFAFDCNKTYRVCISPRDYIAPTDGWKMISTIPSSTPQTEILDTTTQYPALTWLCFNEFFDPSDISKVPANYRYAIANMTGMGTVCTTYWERVQACQ